jgi:hypothetical protein
VGRLYSRRQLTTRRPLLRQPPPSPAQEAVKSYRHQCQQALKAVADNQEGTFTSAATEAGDGDEMADTAGDGCTSEGGAREAEGD